MSTQCQYYFRLLVPRRLVRNLLSYNIKPILKPKVKVKMGQSTIDSVVLMYIFKCYYNNMSNDSISILR